MQAPVAVDASQLIDPAPVLAFQLDADDLACAAQRGLREDLVKRTSRPAFDGAPCFVLLVPSSSAAARCTTVPASSSGSRSKAILAEGMDITDRAPPILAPST